MRAVTRMGIHYLKTAEPYFSDVESGKKDFELRQYTSQYKGDPSCAECHGEGCGECADNWTIEPARDFRVGDDVWLICKDNESRSTIRRIKYVLKDTDPHMEGRMQPGYCILGLEAL